ncbi:MAG: hypothetical protein LBF60_05585 [Treponema sp.]|jgi:hypothetical protein|nr:hypothetical protein [Treponema sp.]
MTEKDLRDSLIESIEAELKKDADDIDGAFIDCLTDGLYALDGLSPPRLNDEALAVAVRTIRARAAWRRRNTQTKEARKRRFTRRAVRGAAAVCCLVFFTFSANYLTTLATGSCLPSKVGINICCGTKFCRCETVNAEETGHSK